ncbi:protoheme IX farnesyltransferase [Desulforhopalus singaporensis]|uniref:heme o synthase n=1 Tax=Desulforhopalus singaporensis TaxID=91360 RepID=A0A1H0UA85_9BACT|nr:UbiA family prenyltransferase [Desulforhopalus singaporensis]SDP63079.1 protoheme IX farnesyltransferase [Desulforhopalus singaporensis]
MIDDQLRLVKLPLCLFVGFSALFGSVLAASAISVETLTLGGGVVLLAMGGASLNSIQERKIDSTMKRTASRPLVNGRIRVCQAFVQALLLLVAGGMLIYLGSSGSWLVTMIGCFAIVLYNGVYTPLKQSTPYALIPGAVCGALPPCIGWLGSGGELFSYPHWLLFFLFFLWQVPHFWLITLYHKNDYKNSAQPSLVKQLREKRLERLFFTWIGALVTVMMMFLSLPIRFDDLFRYAIVFNGVALLGCFYTVLAGRFFASNYRNLFTGLNLSLLFHMIIVLGARLTTS